MSLTAVTHLFLPVDKDPHKHGEGSLPGQRGRQHMGTPLPFQHAYMWISSPSLSPQQPKKTKTEQLLWGQQDKTKYKHIPTRILLLYLPLQQSLMSQSLTGGLFPLIQLLSLLLYDVMKTLQMSLCGCASVMNLFSSINLRGKAKQWLIYVQK